MALLSTIIARLPTRAAALLGLLVLGLPLGQAVALELTKEQKLKAAFVYNFTKFIEWPAASFERAGNDIVIGTLCEESLSAELERVVGDRNVNGHSIRVLRLDGVEAALGAHLVYVCADETERFGRLGNLLAGRPVVTVGESESAARLGATIVFVVVDDRIRFDVDARSAEAAGVKISAQLLKLARTVQRR